MSKKKKTPRGRPPQKSTAARKTTAQKNATTQKAAAAQPSQRAGSASKSPRSREEAPQKRRRSSFDRARILWAVITALVIAALLLQFTLISIDFGIEMLTHLEFIGLWWIVIGYIMSCIPAAFGLLIATGHFWRSMTHSLWIGLIYGAIGFIFLDRLLPLVL